MFLMFAGSCFTFAAVALVEGDFFTAVTAVTLAVFGIWMQENE